MLRPLVCLQMWGRPVKIHAVAGAIQEIFEACVVVGIPLLVVCLILLLQAGQSQCQFLHQAYQAAKLDRRRSFAHPVLSPETGKQTPATGFGMRSEILALALMRQG